MTIPEVGEQWTRFVDRFDRIANFGFMIAETSRGRVVLGPGGAPQVLYRLNDTDRRRILRGQSLLAQLFLTSGAQAVWPAIRAQEAINSQVAALALEHEGARSIPAHRLELSAYHPLGTCRMGRDPATSVVNGHHEAHDLPGLFVVDGSAVSGPLGVNPQITIMALAERAGVYLADRLEQENAAAALRSAAAAERVLAARSAAQAAEEGTGEGAGEAAGDDTGVPAIAARVPTALAARPGIEFAETMSGSCTRLSDGRRLDARFTVRASAPRAAEVARTLLTEGGGTFTLAGTTFIDELASDRACVGTLRMRPLRTRGTLIYDLDFAGDDGAAYHLHGEKSVRLSSMLSGMTTLTTEIARAADGVPVARGTLTFALTDLLPFLGTWRVRTALAAS